MAAKNIALSVPILILLLFSEASTYSGYWCTKPSHEVNVTYKWTVNDFYLNNTYVSSPIFSSFDNPDFPWYLVLRVPKVFNATFPYVSVSLVHLFSHEAHVDYTLTMDVKSSGENRMKNSVNVTNSVNVGPSSKVPEWKVHIFRIPVINDSVFGSRLSVGCKLKLTVKNFLHVC
ncbi:hypothetical protein TSAR_003952 [Trichomalopsis sarcophagae]|uniref:MATH domain-containing protein n=1 Tax=Trichomalopsis sarcophagae TaxID=543379 RepID=A0A232ESX8_9HYME|nr:hypothetical protein TSAR_003952 [Trichomalopsis sarcophagae]